MIFGYGVACCQALAYQGYVTMSPGKKGELSCEVRDLHSMDGMLILVSWIGRIVNEVSMMLNQLFRCGYKILGPFLSTTPQWSVFGGIRNITTYLPFGNLAGLCKLTICQSKIIESSN